MKRVALIIAVAALAALSMGQGRGMRMFGGRGGGLIMLASREDVAKELSLSSDQKTKIEDLQEKARDEMRAAFQGMTPGQRPDEATMKAMRSKMETMMAEQNKALGTILTADQMKRLKELRLQRAGNGAIMEPDIQKELGLTADQLAKIKDLQDKQQAAMSALFEKMRNQEIDRDEMRSTMQKNMKIMDDELAKILTADQKSKLETMKGKPFTFEEDDNGG